MWTVPVVPSEEQREFSAETLSVKRHENPPRSLVLHRLNEPFHHGHAAVLSNGTEARPDPSPPAPALEPETPELLASVADEILGRCFA